MDFLEPVMVEDYLFPAYNTSFREIIPEGWCALGLVSVTPELKEGVIIWKARFVNAEGLSLFERYNLATNSNDDGVRRKVTHGGIPRWANILHSLGEKSWQKAEEVPARALIAKIEHSERENSEQPWVNIRQTLHPEQITDRFGDDEPLCERLHDELKAVGERIEEFKRLDQLDIPEANFPDIEELEAELGEDPDEMLNQLELE